VDVLHRDLLLAFAAVAIERIKQHRVSAGEFVGLAQILAPSLERLFAEHGASIAFHRSVMGGDKLCRDHAFEFIPWLDAHQRIDRRMAFPAGFLPGLNLQKTKAFELSG